MEKGRWLTLPSGILLLSNQDVSVSGAEDIDLNQSKLSLSYEQFFPSGVEGRGSVLSYFATQIFICLFMPLAAQKLQDARVNDLSQILHALVLLGEQHRES